MSRDNSLARIAVCWSLSAMPLWVLSAGSLAAPVEFVPITSTVSGPPYPTGAVTSDIVTDVAGTPVIIDRFSSLIGDLAPVGAVDWFIADSFSFGVEREMKESGEKGGTADINIGVGELQECTISKSMDHSSITLAQHAINGNSLSLMFEAESAAGTVKFITEFTTPQPAVFTNVSALQGRDSRTLDLNCALLYSAPYDPQLPILREVMTGNFIAIPEPASSLLLVGACFGACMLSRVKYRSESARP
jgi:hypothetical protein